MARTLTPLTGGGAGSAYVAGDKWGFQTAEKVRQALDMALYLAGHFDLGGDERGILSGAFVPVNGPRTFTIQGDNTGGLTLEAVVFYYTANAATTVQARIRNTTDSTTSVTGTASAATTVTREVLTLVLAAGSKDYQLQVTGSDALNPVFCWGFVRTYKVPA